MAFFSPKLTVCPGSQTGRLLWAELCPRPTNAHWSPENETVLGDGAFEEAVGVGLHPTERGP